MLRLKVVFKSRKALVPIDATVQTTISLVSQRLCSLFCGSVCETATLSIDGFELLSDCATKDVLRDGDVVSLSVDLPSLSPGGSSASSASPDDSSSESSDASSSPKQRIQPQLQQHQPKKKKVDQNQNILMAPPMSLGKAKRKLIENMKRNKEVSKHVRYEPESDEDEESSSSSESSESSEENEDSSSESSDDDDMDVDQPIKKHQQQNLSTTATSQKPAQKLVRKRAAQKPQQQISLPTPVVKQQQQPKKQTPLGPKEPQQQNQPQKQQKQEQPGPEKHQPAQKQSSSKPLKQPPSKQQEQEKLPPPTAIHTHIELYDDIPSPDKQQLKRKRGGSKNKSKKSKKNNQSENNQPLDYGDDEFGNNSKPSSTTMTVIQKKPPVDYESLEKIDVLDLPPIGTHIAFKTLEMDPDTFCPQLSGFKEASILEIHQKTKTLVLQLLNSQAKREVKQFAPKRKALYHFDYSTEKQWDEEENVEEGEEREDREEEEEEYVMLDELNGCGDGKITVGWRDLIDPRFLV
ncbi:UNVERIFIED_CONTAM: hypothetical protein HDU68_011138 [Siphonaria sp. JEL0065]|nr:hypothetical protein HDU68_011138 [Siphonaria sp. JEL0065]